MAIVVDGLTKAYGPKTVVDDLSFEVVPGKVTGFLGPNGAGKSTTMRLMLDLDRPDAGRVTVDGQRFRDIQYPARAVGTLLEAQAVHPKRTARNHLRMLAACSRVPDSRVDEVMEVTGITPAANKTVGAFSLGMRQRLGLASALLGDPIYMMLDEPANGLDPEGMRWIRKYLRGLANEGRAVFVSSHLLAELSLFVDYLIVIGKGRLMAMTSVDEFMAESQTAILVRTPRPDELKVELENRGATVLAEDGELRVSDTSAAAIGDLAALLGIPLHGLREKTTSLEDAFLELTADEREYRTGGTPGENAAPSGEVAP
ncbi:MAG: ATP-binding cassette domain-containing protein [Acidimicrobiia bacterium]|nr:ATP-binding cassette domain-containing protein [Acidimicrobiia bacterium]MDH3396231.1 ATP-binding cassette domain-containing protein [Acidimicrobiia bacterium]